jgi:acetyltransferase-like isoleucine patch superfamily enzyme
MTPVTAQEPTPVRPARFGGRLQVPRLRSYLTLRHALGFLRWAGWRLRFPRQRWPMFWIEHGATIFIGPQGRVEIGRGVVIHPDVTIHVHGTLRLADGVTLGRGVYLDADELVSIGRGSGLAEWVSVHDGQHLPGLDDTPFMQRPYQTRPIVIEDNVWLGAKVTVQGGVRIGHHSVVGSNAVVTKDIPAGVVAAGIPAAVIRELDA